MRENKCNNLNVLPLKETKNNFNVFYISFITLIKKLNANTKTVNNKNYLLTSGLLGQGNNQNAILTHKIGRTGFSCFVCLIK